MPTGNPTPIASTVRMDFRSDYGILDFVQVVSDHLSREAGLDDDSVHWVGVAVRESVINAIKHGNCHDQSKRVFVEFTALTSEVPAGLAVSVRDQGCGFDPAALPDPLAPENVLKPSGRGIFLIRSFMDEIAMRPVPGGGMEVRLVKRVHAAHRVQS